MKTGTELILAERARQISQEGWSAEHDDMHANQELQIAAGCYLDNAFGRCKQPPTAWPWAKRLWKPKDPIRNLVRAGALYLAEIDRQKRLGAPKIILKPLGNMINKCVRLIDERQKPKRR